MAQDDGRPRVPAEIELVLLLSTPRLRAGEVERLRELAGQVLDWNQVFGMLVLHRTGGVAWRNVIEHDLHEPSSFRPLFALKGLEMMFRAQQLLVREQLEQNARLVAEFDRRGITSALMKGIAVVRMGYPDPGMRTFNDNDLLFERIQLGEVGALLKELGYVQGWWDPKARVVRPAARSEVLLHSVTSHETFPYARATPGAAILSEHRIDVHFSVDLLTSNRNDDTVSDLLGRRVEIGTGGDGGRLSSLHQEDMFVFVCVHFQREACNRREVEMIKDLVLYKLVDLLALLESEEFPIDLASTCRRAHELGLAPEVYFSLVHLDALFPGRIPAGVLDSVRPESVAYLDQVTHNGAPVHSWQRPIPERFFDPRRQLEFASS
jgi:hypothetical protein